MAEQSSSRSRRKSHLSRNSSLDSPDDSISAAMLKSVKEKKPKKKERWLLTRKTWRYMADAGRKLIPDGSHNRVEDIPKIEAHFQELCRREPGFLLWRKNSYPGAFSRKSYRKRKDRLKGGYRKSISTDDFGRSVERPKDLPLFATSGGRTDMYKLNQQLTKSKSAWELSDEPLEQQLIEMLEKYLYVSGQSHIGQNTSSSLTSLDYQQLMEKLQTHLGTVSKSISQPYITTTRREGVHFEGDHITKSLTETLSRYFSQSPKRDKVISDFLTDRKALEKLYFELRQAKGFRSNRTGFYTGTKPHVNKWYPWKSSWKSPPSSLPTSPRGREVTFEEPKISYRNSRAQTEKLSDEQLFQIEQEYKRELAEREEQEKKEMKEYKPPAARRRSSVDNDDVSQSVSDTIKRYLRMARKKSVDADKNDRFKRINYDRNLRNIKAKGEITKPGDDDGLNKGCQTNEDWIMTYRDLEFDEPEPDTFSDPDSCFTSSRNSIDIGNSESTHSGFLTNLSNLIYGKSNDKSLSSSAANNTAAMQKSKSSSSVVHHGSRLVAKKIFRSRSKSQTRASTAHLTWTPQGNCTWNNVTGRQVLLNDTTLLQLSEVERRVLRQVALAKLQALNLGVNIKIPTDSTSSPTSHKPKRRAYLLKRKALTTGFFEGSKKEGEKEKEGSTSSGGLVFGIPLSQCVENDRLTKAAARTSPLRQRGESTLTRQGSRGSFSSLNEAPKDENGSCDSLMIKEKELTGSVPGLLDSISNYGSTADLNAAVQSEEPAVPNILNVCLRHLQINGLHTLGIFRVSTSKKRVRQLREDFDCGRETTLDEEQCPHDVATLLKEYLRDLPDPLLCRDLYHVFVQTQRIRNRRLQFEALQHLIQLLPTPNRDTLWALLIFLADVARHSNDQTDPSGESIQGNKMDSNNLATVFAPNILHCNKPGAKDVEKPEDRIDVINVVRTLIDYNEKLFTISAELLDEVYVHMMDSHPEILESLLNRRININAASDDYADDVDSESNSAPLTPTVPSSHMSIEHVLMNDSDGFNTPPESRRTWSREEFLHEMAATGGPNMGMRIRHKEKDRLRDKSTKKKQREDGITVISRMHSHDSSTTSKNRSSSMDSSSSQYDNLDSSRTQNDSSRKESYASEADGVIRASLTIPVQQGFHSSPPSWASSPPTSPDYSSIAVNYIPEEVQSKITLKSTPTPKSTPKAQKISIATIPEPRYVKIIKEPIPLQPTTADIQKSFSAASITRNLSGISGPQEREQKFTTSISSIGNAVLKSRTADFERIAKVEAKTSKPVSTTTTTTTANSDKKKYTKRRYTDSRHPTKHIPDAETLESATTKSVSKASDSVKSSTQATPVYKRRELISSVQTK
ncbi:uncharacterized protein LOC108739746 isoform X2 [Agrilus planipennis]|uniref:Uncharacterized protein LOC108739746 isoform X2 n=1 Tax=Agrilus planipennis TaxID=224129 RepID=A0A7F5RJ40_AGRPL|nr:uncharacterized protein LOC108739746 isoform X2 [Agrilus planipennis]